MDVEACNYQEEALCDDGTCASCEQLQTACGPGTIWDDENQQCIVADGVCGWNPDADADEMIGVGDLLMFLSVFGSEWPPFECGDDVTYQGYDYATVQIGEQCWFAENLRSLQYSNGDSIPTGLDEANWENTISGATAVYGEGPYPCNTASPDGDACDELWSLGQYGRLYNWFAIDDMRGICPVGWHVPSDEEWTTLTDHLGGAEEAGSQMKTDYGWHDGGNGSNSSGFSGLPGGCRSNFGYSGSGGSAGYWWSSTPVGASASWYRDLGAGYSHVYRNDGNNGDGFSVRCIQDAE
jgi:uncharacterized protein (TIGR02145 family)